MLKVIAMPELLWWGRSDPAYSRNRLVLRLLADLGWRVAFYHPTVSPLGWLTAYGRRIRRPDLVWVPCFRQRDLASAALWAGKWQVPLVADPLISAYEKEVFERCKWPPDSRRARARRRWEARQFSMADLVVADTPAHAGYFEQVLDVARERTAVLYVGAEDDRFTPRPAPAPDPPFEVLFYGSFLKLQGPEIIVAAARLAGDLPVNWVLLGDGDLRPAVEEQARGLGRVRFEPWTPYERLPDRLARAHVILGVFGTTVKAGLVIPNKMFQAMAAGRPVITRASAAYPREMADSPVIGWIPAGDPQALAAKVGQWVADPGALAQRGEATRQLFDRYFHMDRLREDLARILERALA